MTFCSDRQASQYECYYLQNIVITSKIASQYLQQNSKFEEQTMIFATQVIIAIDGSDRKHKNTLW